MVKDSRNGLADVAIELEDKYKREFLNINLSGRKLWRYYDTP
jgi:hypothetical protein